MEGLRVCGFSMDRGGGVSGIPGADAARDILEDRRIKPSVKDGPSRASTKR